MPDHQDDHWDFLAADLGAPPPADEEPKQEKSETSDAEVESDVAEEPHDEVPADDMDEVVEGDLELAEEDQEDTLPEKPRQPKSGRKGDRVVSGFGHRRGNVDWANLAQELGVEAMEEAPAPIPAADSAAESQASPIFAPEPVNMEPAMEQTEPVGLEPEPVAPLPEPAIGGFGAGIIEDVSSDSSSHTPKESSGADEVQEERKGRRRRRRRKPKKQESPEEQPVEAVIVEEEEAEAKSPPQDQEEEEEKGRPRHRGRRRGGRKRAPREEATTEPEQFGAGLAADEANLVADDDDFEIFDAEDDEDDEDDESTGKQGTERSKDGHRSKKVTHRGIPSWDEAVGHIIDSNLEDRSKRPDSGGSRQRPGRRRGGDRSGNRGRS